MTGRSRSLWPREHGAYVQLLAPLAVSLIAAPSAAGSAMAGGAAVAFVASESLRVVLGGRGARRQEADGPRARRWLAVLAPWAIALGSIGLATAPDALGFAAALFLPIGLVIALAQARKVESLAGEILAAVALAGAATPVAIAGGLDAARTLALWGAWSTGYATTVVAAHAILAHHQRTRGKVSSRWPHALYLIAASASLAVIAAIDPIAWCTAPLAVVAALLVLRPPRATRLRAVGIGLLTTSVVAAAAAVATLRLGVAP